MKEIITDYNELSEISEAIDIRKENEEMRVIISSLKEIVRAKNLVALSAPQIGYKRRIFVINFRGDVRTFINPVISQVKGFELAREKCSSIPGKEFLRPRHNNITVIYQNPLSKTVSQKLVGQAAIIFQEQMDHLDGLLLSDIGLEVDEQFDKASEEEKMEVINAYLDSLDIKQKAIDKEIEENKDLKEISDAVKFIDSVSSGETKLGEGVQVKVVKKE